MVTILPRAPTQVERFYPETDGEPLAESDFQREPLTYAVSALRRYFEGRPDVYVSGNLFIYYLEGVPACVVAPDVFVVFGVGNHDRAIYQVWEEGKAPDLVIEITSKKTRRKDEREKPRTYARLKVKEYFQYDPTGEYLVPALKGRRLDARGRYRPIAGRWLSGEVLALKSQVLGLELRLEEGRLRLFDPSEERYLLTYREAEEARQKAEARIRELEAEVARLRGGRRGRTV
ncbi:MAG: Uma2 family endonuclease [Chloroflexaceae bacterium]|nr:Uma2 family endonuclease [Chloroflexaceae bacterium]